MKAISEILAAVLVILISMVCVALVLEFSSPSLGRLKEVSLFQEGQKILTDINNAVRAVTQEGSGSTRVLQLSISGGEYFIDTENNAVIFSMESRAQIIGIGLSKTEGGINMYGELNMVYLNISYNNIDVTGNETFGKGYHNLIIRNNGYNQTSNKQIISITTKPPVLPPTVIFNSYNQFGTPYIVRGEKTAGNYIDLNNLG